ncbi:uracil-DNA glycosylase [Flavobacterium enshiense]|uniref:uracil-DNA glycosylase n=1 Tax=Flavobacterium enshiense TaxID=1341165 RepID=UPI00345D7C40
MQVDIHASWKAVLSEEFEKPYFKELLRNVEEEYDAYTCFPPKHLIFNAFNHCPFDDVKVIIIGQDPYHGEGEANGLAFSVNDTVKIPPSLLNIYKEINCEYNRIILPNSGNLERWAKQGVLLLNATLTVRKDIANSHKQIEWQRFTDAIIKKLSDEKEHLVFLLWGAFAQKKANLIDEKKHDVLISGHPSFAGVHKKWFGNNHFNQTNVFLKKMGKNEIVW